MSDAPSCMISEIRKARKQHRCCECPSPIMPGEHYEHVSGVWDGRGESFKTCEPCAVFRQQFMQDLDQYRFAVIVSFGHLWEEYSDFWDNN